MLGSEQNQRSLVQGLLDIGREGMRRQHKHHKRIILDVDSYPYETHGRQDGAAY